MAAERGGAWRWRQGEGGSSSSTMVDSAVVRYIAAEGNQYTNKNYYLRFRVINSDSELLTRIPS